MRLLGGDVAGGKVQCRLCAINLSSKSRKDRSAIKRWLRVEALHLRAFSNQARKPRMASRSMREKVNSVLQFPSHLSYKLQKIERLSVGENRILTEAALLGQILQKETPNHIKKSFIGPYLRQERFSRRKRESGHLLQQTGDQMDVVVSVRELCVAHVCTQIGQHGVQVFALTHPAIQPVGSESMTKS